MGQRLIEGIRYVDKWKVKNVNRTAGLWGPRRNESESRYEDMSMIYERLKERRSGDRQKQK